MQVKMMRSKKALDNAEVEKALNLILEIKDNQKFFSIFINQSQRYLEYVSELKKVI